MARPPKRKQGTGRVTPKGGVSRVRSEGAGTPGGSPVGKDGSASFKSRSLSDEPVPEYRPASAGSPKWVPILMFGLLAVGFLVIIINYMFGADASNWFLLLGLGLILGGIITATQYR